VGKESRFVKTDAPVVVRPEADSKIASVRLKLLSGNIKNGIEPNRASINQKDATIIKPSFSLISETTLLLGTHRTNPPISVKVNDAKKEEAVYVSSDIPATIKGAIIEKLNTINNNPKVF